MTDPFPTLPLTNAQRRCFLATVAKCERFIEQHADSKLAHLKEHVDYCQKHRVELLTLLEET